MTPAILITREVFDEAMAAARELKPATVTVKGLASVPDAGLLGRLNSTWAAIEESLTTAFLRGKEKASALIQSALSKIDQVMDSAQNTASELQALLLQKLRTFVQGLYNKALLLMPTTVAIGDRSMGMVSMTCHWRLKLGGSIKASFLEAAELVSEGELEIEIEYTGTGASLKKEG